MEAFENQVSLPLLLFTFLPFFLLLHASSSAQAEDDKPPSDCFPFHYMCGGVNHFNISYPFRTDGYFEDRCSHPGKEFEISCNHNDNSSEIEIKSHKYHVEMIDYENQTLTIVDKDFFGSKSNDNCLSPLNNTTLDFKFSNYQTQGDPFLTFLNNCSFFGYYQGFRFLPCLSNLTTKTHTYFTLQQEIPNWFEEHCQVVKIPILKESWDRLEKGPESDEEAAWNDALRDGFQITWSPIDPSNQCGKCVRANGHCHEICYCDGQPHCGEHPVPCDGQPQCDSHNAKGGGHKKNHTAIIDSHFTFEGLACTSNAKWCTCTMYAKSLPLISTSSRTCRPKIRRYPCHIEVASAAVGGVLICAIICFVSFWFYRKRLISSVSSKLLSCSISSDPPLRSDLEKSNSLYVTHVFDYKELEEATNNFDPSKELGDGGFGIVYHGKLRDGRNIAVKRLYENNCRCVEQFKNEIKILSQLCHQNLVTLYGCSSRHTRELLLVYEFIPNGTVADHLHSDCTKPGALTWPTRMSIAIETADALKYLHAVEIIHRDVKTNNILLDNNFHVKVADFGLSRLFPTNVTHISTVPQRTLGYVDPDYHRCYQLTDKSDVYSFGVVLIELISSKPPVDITRHRHEINLADMALDKIQNSALNELVDPSLGFDSNYGVRRMITSVAELAFRCLQDEKESRPSMEEVLEQLRGIESEEYNVEKVELKTAAEDEALLKKMLPLSPDIVTDAWQSRTTNPNTSG